MNGHVAEWLGEGLQNLLQQFDSVHRPLFSYLYGKQSLGGRCFYTAQFLLGLTDHFNMINSVFVVDLTTLYKAKWFVKFFKIELCANFDGTIAK